MKIKIISILLFGIALSEEIPMLINYQAKLVDDNNNPIIGTISVTFRFYDSLENGNIVWDETHPSLNTNNGLISVLLGSVSEINKNHFSGSSLFLETEVANYGILTPRQQLTSVPYAIKAENTLKLLYYSTTDIHFSGGQGTVIGFDTTFTNASLSEFIKVEIKGSNSDSHYRFAPELFFGEVGNEQSFEEMYILTIKDDYYSEYQPNAVWNIPVSSGMIGSNLRIFIQWTTDLDPPFCNFCRGNGTLKELFIWGK